jgi:beta-glucosidase/6-phospho-beta-glucosidase/beta-galactosidase
MENHDPLAPPSLFRSFWLGGFESACQITQAGRRLDMLAVTQHDRQAAGDYARLREVGIRAARDGVRWPLIERAPGRYDFSSLAPMATAAREHGIQVLWNICHYGWPDDLDIFAPAFVDRFARFCGAVARFFADQSDEVPFYTPINEISFLAWAAGSKGYIYPCQRDRGLELKRQLVRAVVAGCEAIWEVDPRARIVHVDPIIHVVTPRARPELAEAAAGQRAGQFESWDMLAGRAHPDLGGSMRYLDIMGLNFYHSNQWEHPGDDENARLRWEDSPRDERWVPLHRLLGEVYERYGRPLFLSETSHFGVGRAPWIAEIAVEVAQARASGTPIEGICIYPILDRPDWDNLSHWHHSGLWDVDPMPDGTLRRVLNREYAAELARSQALLGL